MTTASPLTVAHHKITPTRREKYLAVLRSTGSHSAASREASHHLPAKTGDNRKAIGYQSFLDLRKNDPTFAVACEEALADCLAGVETAIMDRAMKPPTRPVLDREGNVVAVWEDRNSSDRLLLKVAAKLNREEWSERATIDHNVTVKGAILSITPSDVLLLDPKDQERFMVMCDIIADRKGEPPAIDHQPTPYMPPLPVSSHPVPDYEPISR